MLTPVRSQVVNITEVLVKAVAEMRTGRITWRVMLVLTIPAFAAGIFAGLTPLS